MEYRLCKSLVKLRDQINAKYPDRDKKSDGWIGDAKHKSRRSDHNAWFQDNDGIGVVSAIDIDTDLGIGENVQIIVNNLFKSRDVRIKYLIFNGLITQRGNDGIIAKWIPYKGVNKHKQHFHISVKMPLRFCDDERDWKI